jgi:hypothetical protein
MWCTGVRNALVNIRLLPVFALKSELLLKFTRMRMVATNVNSNSSFQAADPHHFDLQIMLIGAFQLLLVLHFCTSFLNN